jgi:hypothetical protein
VPGSASTFDLDCANKRGNRVTYRDEVSRNENAEIVGKQAGATRTCELARRSFGSSDVACVTCTH